MWKMGEPDLNINIGWQSNISPGQRQHTTTGFIMHSFTITFQYNISLLSLSSSFILKHLNCVTYITIPAEVKAVRH